MDPSLECVFSVAENQWLKEIIKDKFQKFVAQRNDHWHKRSLRDEFHRTHPNFVERVQEDTSNDAVIVQIVSNHDTI